METENYLTPEVISFVWLIVIYISNDHKLLKSELMDGNAQKIV